MTDGVVRQVAVVGAGAWGTALADLLALFVFWTHRANIARLRRGEEYRFGRKAPS